jgi:hypothetical protein
MTSFGRTVAGATSGVPLQVVADNEDVDWKTGGVTVDWATVAAVSGADVVLNDGITVKIGQKYLRYGQVLCKITASGKYGPYDPNDTLGRQLLVRGNAWVLNQTVLEHSQAGFDILPSAHPAVFNGARVWKDRLIQSGVVAHTLALGPTLAEFEAVFPDIDYVDY